MPLFDQTPSDYRPVIEIARGGMGTVSLVVRDHGHFERLHALKRLRPELLDDPHMRAMFLDEARIAGLVRHPNVVSVTDVGEDEAGPYLVMEYVDGVSLSALLGRLVAEGRVLPMATALELMRQVAAGLRAAHELTDPQGEPLGVIHRDVSPQNILIGFDGYARLTDFGIARALGRSARTQTGILKGKIGYLAPEVLRFEEPDHRTDLFAFGVVLYESLTMKRLYPASAGPKSARAILNEPPPDVADAIPDAPDALVELLFALLAKEPRHRPASAADVEATLRRILAEVTMDVPAPPVAELLAELFEADRAERAAEITAARATESRRRPLYALWVGVGATVLAAAVAVVYAGGAEETAPDVRTEMPPLATEPAEPAEPPLPVPLATPDAGTMEAPPEPRRRPRRRPSGMMKAIAPMWDWQ